MKLLKDLQFVCFDCEMTGLDPEKDRIIEIAAIRFTFSEIKAEFETLIDPECPISPEALAIHRIFPEMLLGKPKIATILPSFFQFLGDDILVGHGPSYDFDMLNRAATRAAIPSPLGKLQLIDTLRLARHYGDSPNNSLDKLAAHFNIVRDGAHRAMNDVKMNIEVFKHLVRRYKTIEEVRNILAHPIKMKYMPLGKYKGRLFSEIPLQYLQHASYMDFDQDLLFSIRAELKKRKAGGNFLTATNPFAGL